MDLPTGIRLAEPTAHMPSTFVSFAEIARSKDSSVGGKAYNLAVLSHLGFPVPEGVTLSALPQSEEAWSELHTWWEGLGHPPLAARSSAQGEDAANASFAGQLLSVLEIRSEEELKDALQKCFASKERGASLAYQDHFGRELKGMNVLLQRMIDPLFSGVYFSYDPRGVSGTGAESGSATWLIEVVEGLGEKLVSGQTTPTQYRADTVGGPSPELSLQSTEWKPSYTQGIAAAGASVADALGFAVDMEWAIDRDGKLWVLQARPITTGRGEIDPQILIHDHLEGLKSRYSPTTMWDSQSFVEWTGLPSPLSFEVWAGAFNANGAFVRAMQEVGYKGTLPLSDDEEASLLEEVFGRACVNLDRLKPMFFGQIPYQLVPTPHPHLEFSWRSIDPGMILHAPSAIARMIKVAWNLHTELPVLLDRCESELRRSESDYVRPSRQALEAMSLADLQAGFEKLLKTFSSETLKWPLILAMLAESTMETLELALAKDLGEEKGRALLRHWMSVGLQTVTREMEEVRGLASTDPEAHADFLSRFGHRGPGELDLTHPRWEEMGEAAFTSAPAKPQAPLSAANITADINENIHAIRRILVDREWHLLKRILELRERWKMQIMKPYADLRNYALFIGSRAGLDNDVFFLRPSEILSLSTTDTRAHQAIERLCHDRKQRQAAFRKLALPVAFTLEDLERIVSGRSKAPLQEQLTGEPLSPGVASGEVRIVRDPLQAATENWPENVILVAEATDPGWTPLFHRSVGVIVERGGVLSHCAIVAREMGLPAVSRVDRCTETFKDGDHVWLDGNSGRITRTESR